MNLFDIMRAAGGGNAFADLAARFGLSEADVAKAVQAFMPAFSAGLQRSTADPLGLMEMMRKLTAADYLKAFQDAGWAAGPGRGKGEEVLGFLFGSPEAARAVATQAGAFAGLAQDKMLELMPALASMLFGGLASQASAAANPMLDTMLKPFRAAAGMPPSARGPLDRHEAAEAERIGAAGELGRAQAEMMNAGMAAFQAGAAAWQQAAGAMLNAMGGGAVTPPAGDAAEQAAGQTAGKDVFGELFEPGLKAGEAYQRQMEAILDRFRPPKTG